MIPQARNEGSGTLAPPESPLAADGQLNPPSRTPQPLGMKVGESGADGKIGSTNAKFMVIKSNFGKFPGSPVVRTWHFHRCHLGSIPGQEIQIP